MDAGADTAESCLSIGEEGEVLWQPVDTSKAEPAIIAQHTVATPHDRIETVEKRCLEERAVVVLSMAQQSDNKYCQTVYRALDSGRSALTGK